MWNLREIACRRHPPHWRRSPDASAAIEAPAAAAERKCFLVSGIFTPIFAAKRRRRRAGAPGNGSWRGSVALARVDEPVGAAPKRFLSVRPIAGDFVGIALFDGLQRKPPLEERAKPGFVEKSVRDAALVAFQRSVDETLDLQALRESRVANRAEGRKEPPPRLELGGDRFDRGADDLKRCRGATRGWRVPRRSCRSCLRWSRRSRRASPISATSNPAARKARAFRPDPEAKSMTRAPPAPRTAMSSTASGWGGRTEACSGEVGGIGRVNQGAYGFRDGHYCRRW